MRFFINFRGLSGDAENFQNEVKRTSEVLSAHIEKF